MILFTRLQGESQDVDYVYRKQKQKDDMQDLSKRRE